MTVLRDLPRLKYLTTKANNYWKTIAKKVIYIPRRMPKSVRIFSLFLVNDARLRSNFKNSRFLFHRGFQTLENSKSTRPTASCFHQFSRVWKPRWNTRTRFWNITSNLSCILLCCDDFIFFTVVMDGRCDLLFIDFIGSDLEAMSRTMQLPY